MLLDEGEWTATQNWEYQGDGENGSGQFGDIQRLPNGNALVTYSTIARIVEANPSGEVVQSFTNDMYEASSSPFGVFGYASFRSSLYGPPPR